MLIRQVTMAEPIQDPTVSSTTVDEEDEEDMEQPLQDPTVSTTTGPVEEDEEELFEDMPVYILYCENCGRGFISMWQNTLCTVCQPSN